MNFSTNFSYQGMMQPQQQNDNDTITQSELKAEQLKQEQASRSGKPQDKLSSMLGGPARQEEYVAPVDSPQLEGAKNPQKEFDLKQPKDMANLGNDLKNGFTSLKDSLPQMQQILQQLTTPDGNTFEQVIKSLTPEQMKNLMSNSGMGKEELNQLLQNYAKTISQNTPNETSTPEGTNGETDANGLGQELSDNITSTVQDYASTIAKGVIKTFSQSPLPSWLSNTQQSTQQSTQQTQQTNSQQTQQQQQTANNNSTSQQTSTQPTSTNNTTMQQGTTNATQPNTTTTNNANANLNGTTAQQTSKGQNAQQAQGTASNNKMNGTQTNQNTQETNSFTDSLFSTVNDAINNPQSNPKAMATSAKNKFDRQLINAQIKGVPQQTINKLRAMFANPKLQEQATPQEQTLFKEMLNEVDKEMHEQYDLPEGWTAEGQGDNKAYERMAQGEYNYQMNKLINKQQPPLSEEQKNMLRQVLANPNDPLPPELSNIFMSMQVEAMQNTEEFFPMSKQMMEKIKRLGAPKGKNGTGKKDTSEELMDSQVSLMEEKYGILKEMKKTLFGVTDDQEQSSTSSDDSTAQNTDSEGNILDLSDLNGMKQDKTSGQKSHQGKKGKGVDNAINNVVNQQSQSSSGLPTSYMDCLQLTGLALANAKMVNLEVSTASSRLSSVLAIIERVKNVDMVKAQQAQADQQKQSQKSFGMRLLEAIGLIFLSCLFPPFLAFGQLIVAFVAADLVVNDGKATQAIVKAVTKVLEFFLRLKALVGIIEMMFYFMVFGPIMGIVMGFQYGHAFSEFLEGCGVSQQTAQMIEQIISMVVSMIAQIVMEILMMMIPGAQEAAIAAIMATVLSVIARVAQIVAEVVSIIAKIAQIVVKAAEVIEKVANYLRKFAVAVEKYAQQMETYASQAQVIAKVNKAADKVAKSEKAVQKTTTVAEKAGTEAASASEQAANAIAKAADEAKNALTKTAKEAAKESEKAAQNQMKAAEKLQNVFEKAADEASKAKKALQEAKDALKVAEKEARSKGVTNAAEAAKDFKNTGMLFQALDLIMQLVTLVQDLVSVETNIKQGKMAEKVGKLKAEIQQAQAFISMLQSIISDILGNMNTMNKRLENTAKILNDMFKNLSAALSELSSA